MESYWESENTDDWKRREKNARNSKVACCTCLSVQYVATKGTRWKSCRQRRKPERKGRTVYPCAQRGNFNVSQASWNILRAVSFSHLWKLPSTCNIRRRREGRRKGQEPSISDGMSQVQHLKEQLWWLGKGREKKKKKTEWVCGAGVALSFVCCLLLEWWPLWDEEGIRRRVKWTQGGFGMVFNGKYLKVTYVYICFSALSSVCDVQKCLLSYEC